MVTVPAEFLLLFGPKDGKGGFCGVQHLPRKVLDFHNWFLGVVHCRGLFSRSFQDSSSDASMILVH